MHERGLEPERTMVDDDFALAPRPVTRRPAASNSADAGADEPRRKLPSLLNGRFQSDLVNLVGVAATAAGAALANGPPDSLVTLGQVMSIGISVVAGLAFLATLGLLASRQWRKVFGKGALVFYLLATLAETGIGATISAGLFRPKEDLKGLVLGGIIAVVVLLAIQCLRQIVTIVIAQRREEEDYQKRLSADHLDGEAVKRATEAHRNSRAEFRAQTPITLGILAILLGAVFSAVQTTHSDFLAGPPDGPSYFAALGWILVEGVTTLIVFRRLGRPRRGYDGEDHQGPGSPRRSWGISAAG